LVVPWAVVSIVAKFTTLEIAIGLDWCCCCSWPVCLRRFLDESVNYHQTFGWSKSGSSAGSEFDCFSDLDFQSVAFDSCFHPDSQNKTENPVSCSSEYSC
jgi:hypothetical protein